MGDVRFDRHVDKLRRAAERAHLLRGMEDAEVIEALAAASRAGDPFLANILATEALNRARRLRSALASLGEGVAALARDGAIHWLNPAAEDILGWPLSEVVGRDFIELADQRDPRGAPIPREASPILRAVRERSVIEGDGGSFGTRDGGRIRVTYSAAPISNEEGEADGAVVAFRDDTRRFEAERELRAERERYRSLFDALPESAIDVDVDGKIIEVNMAAQAMLGRAVSETRGHEFYEYVHPADAPTARRLFGSIVEGRREEVVLRVRHANGAYLLVRAHGIPIIFEGEVVGVHGLVRLFPPDAPTR